MTGQIQLTKEKEEDKKEAERKEEKKEEEQKEEKKAEPKGEAQKEERKAEKEEKKEEKKKETRPEEKKTEIVLKRNYVVPLAAAYAKPAKKRAAKAVKLVRSFASRHFKTAKENVKIDERIASFINCRGSKKPPKRLKVTLAKDKKGIVKILPA